MSEQLPRALASKEPQPSRAEKSSRLSARVMDRRLTHVTEGQAKELLPRSIRNTCSVTLRVTGEQTAGRTQQAGAICPAAVLSWQAGGWVQQSPGMESLAGIGAVVTARPFVTAKGVRLGGLPAESVRCVGGKATRDMLSQWRQMPAAGPRRIGCGDEERQQEPETGTPAVICRDEADQQEPEACAGSVQQHRASDRDGGRAREP